MLRPFAIPKAAQVFEKPTTIAQLLPYLLQVASANQLASAWLWDVFRCDAARSVAERGQAIRQATSLR